MKRSGARNFYLALILSLAFILNAASPACKFISGDMMEICAADGTLQSIPFPGGENPFKTKDETGSHASKNTDCGFCFARTNLQGDSAAQSILVAIDFDTTSIPVFFSATNNLKQAERTGISPRAPPVILI